MQSPLRPRPPRLARRRARGWWPVWRGGGLLLGLLVALALGAPDALAAEVRVSKEDQIKAAFLYNFTKFIEWPGARFADETSPIVIGVLGRSAFSAELENIVKDRAVNGRAIIVKLVATPEEMSAVHLVFVPAGAETRVPAAAWQRSAVVAVGESAAFTALGGTITFVQAGDKVRFEINIAAAERGGVKLSAQLLKLATVVRRSPGGKP